MARKTSTTRKPPGKIKRNKNSLDDVTVLITRYLNKQDLLPEPIRNICCILKRGHPITSPSKTSDVMVSSSQVGKVVSRKYWHATTVQSLDVNSREFIVYTLLKRFIDHVSAAIRLWPPKDLPDPVQWNTECSGSRLIEFILVDGFKTEPSQRQYGNVGLALCHLLSHYLCTHPPDGYIQPISVELFLKSDVPRDVAEEWVDQGGKWLGSHVISCHEKRILQMNERFKWADYLIK